MARCCPGTRNEIAPQRPSLTVKPASSMSCKKALKFAGPFARASWMARRRFSLGFYFCNAAKLFFCKVFKGYFPLPPLALSRRYWKAKSSGFFYSVLPKSIESRICHHLSFLLNVITAWHIKPNTREKQPPPNSDAPHPAPDIVIKPPTKKIPMPRNIPTP